MAGARPLGSFIRRQRELQQLSLRQAAGLAGISNPYLSQIERGLREPSEAVIEALARTLEISADTLYAQAGRRRRVAIGFRALVGTSPRRPTTSRARERGTRQRRDTMLERGEERIVCPTVAEPAVAAFEEDRGFPEGERLVPAQL